MKKYNATLLVLMVLFFAGTAQAATASVENEIYNHNSNRKHNRHRSVFRLFHRHHHGHSKGSHHKKDKDHRGESKTSAIVVSEQVMGYY